MKDDELSLPLDAAQRLLLSRLGIVADEEFPVGGPVLLAPGDLVLLLTDGILETVSSGGEQFGVERVLELVRANRHKPACELIDSLRTAAIAFSDHATLLDDLTMVVVKMQGASDEGRYSRLIVSRS